MHESVGCECCSYSRIESRIFGLFMLSGKATSFIGPLLYGVFVTIFETSQAGMAVALLLIIGFLLLAKILQVMLKLKLRRRLIKK